MVNYEIIEIDINDANRLRQVNKLLSKVFEPISEDKLKLNTDTHTDNKSLYLAAIENNVIIGFNAFISHTFFLNGKSINCYQSCWTATSFAHRGKKIFQNIIEEAKKILLSRNAGFIFGFPNENSQAIFIHKLGFKEYPSVKLNIFNIPFAKSLYFNYQTKDLLQLHQNAILQNNAELYNLKKAEYDGKIIKVEKNDSFIWGIIRIKIVKGIKLSFFDVGGIEIKNITDANLLIKQILKTCNVRFIQLVTTKNNSYNKLFKNIKPAYTNDLIVYDLKLNTSSHNFNFFNGVKDVY